MKTDTEQKIVTTLRWDGSAFELDDIRVLKRLSAEELPCWLTEAANRGMLATGLIGYLELRPSGTLVFKESIP